MNSELEKLIEKYRITVNGLADLEGDYDKIIKERGFVTLNGLLAGTGSPAGKHSEPAAPAPSDNTAENTPVVPAPVESAEVHNEPTPVVPAPSEPATEQPGVTPVVEGPVSGDTNLGNEVAGGERAAGTEEDSASEDDTASTEDSTTGRKPKKKKN